MVPEPANFEDEDDDGDYILLGLVVITGSACDLKEHGSGRCPCVVGSVANTETSEYFKRFRCESRRTPICFYSFIVRPLLRMLGGHVEVKGHITHVCALNKHGLSGCFCFGCFDPTATFLDFSSRSFSGGLGLILWPMFDIQAGIDAHLCCLLALPHGRVELS